MHKNTLTFVAESRQANERAQNPGEREDAALLLQIIDV